MSFSIDRAVIFAMKDTSGIVVATSIPPNLVRQENGCEVGRAYQRYCVESWISAGFRVISLNFTDEIPQLVPQYPMVHFISIDRDASSILGRKTPLLSDLLQVLSEQSEGTVGIINADIFLEAKDWTDAIKSAVDGAIAVAHRIDVNSFVGGDPALYRNGYDIFFFGRRDIPENIAHPFAMGLPWWDYCLPIMFSLRGMKVNLITSPAAFHLRHPTNYNSSHFRFMAHEFAEFVLQTVTAEGVVQDNLVPVVKLCREVAAEPASEDFPRSLYTLGLRKLLSGAGRLPVLRRLAQAYHHEEANRQLSKACVDAISLDVQGFL